MSKTFLSRFDQQVQAAVDCYNAGATMLHFHVRDPKTGQGSSNFDQYNELLARVRQAVPKMIIQVGGSISFAPHTEDAKAKWLDYDTRHMLTELDPKPDFVTVTTGTTLWDITQAFLPERHQGDAPGRPEGAGRLERHGGGFDAGVLRRAPQAAAQEQDPALLRARPRPPARDHRAADPRPASTWGR